MAHLEKLMFACQGSAALLYQADEVDVELVGFSP